MRIRTGHGPDDWTPSIPAEPLSVKGWMFGELIVGNPAITATDQRRAKLAEYKRRQRERERAA